MAEIRQSEGCEGSPVLHRIRVRASRVTALTRSPFTSFTRLTATDISEMLIRTQRRLSEGTP